MNYLNIGDFQRISTTISTKNYWFTINFNLVNESLIDPYIS